MNTDCVTLLANAGATRDIKGKKGRDGMDIASLFIPSNVVYPLAGRTRLSLPAGGELLPA